MTDHDFHIATTTHEARGEDATIALAQGIAARLCPGQVLLLEGDLGAGKTTFARALIRALAGDDKLEVPSPTFTLVQTYDTPRGPVWHFDLYRIKTPDEVWELGWEEALSSAITIVEWPGNLGPMLETMVPPQGWTLHFSADPHRPDIRIITIPDIPLNEGTA